MNKRDREIIRNRAEEAEGLAKDFSTEARELRATNEGRTIVEPLLYDESTYFHQFKELKLQGKIREIIKQAIDFKREVNVEDAINQACEELNIKRDWADKYFASPRYKRWYADRMREIEDHSGLSIEYLAAKHKDNLEGRLKLTSSQLDSAKELGDRIWPKVSKIEHEISQKELTTLDELPDYEKKVAELEQKFRASLPALDAE